MGDRKRKGGSGSGLVAEGPHTAAVVKLGKIDRQGK